MSFEAIGIVSRDLNKSVKFYSHLGLDFKEAGSPQHLEYKTPTGVRIMLDAIELVQNFDPNWQPKKGNGISLCFGQTTADGVDNLFKKLTQEGAVSIKEPWTAFWGQRYACLQDPDGNQIDLFADI